MGHSTPGQSLPLTNMSLDGGRCRGGVQDVKPSPWRCVDLGLGWPLAFCEGF